MPTARPAHHPIIRQAFTLLEMVIVLAVLATLVAVLSPAVRGMLGKSELADAGKQVRAALVRARLRAIESGSPWQFRFQPGTGRFSISCTGPPDIEQDPREPAARAKPLNAAIEGSLPGGVSFDAQSPAPPHGPPEPVAARGQNDLGEAWSTPLIFQADGRALDARIRLQGQEDRYLDVVFRGLTGTAAVGPIRHQETRP